MYEIKNRIFLDFSKTQKSALCNFLRSMVKNHLDLSESELLDKFISDEKYYLEINSSRFEFLAKVIDSEQFLKDCLLYVKECHKYYEYKAKQEPLLRANKEFEKQKKKFVQEQKMSKEPVTQKQIFYYKKLCKRYNEEMKNVEELSKLEMRDEIDRIINEHQTT